LNAGSLAINIQGETFTREKWRKTEGIIEEQEEQMKEEEIK
jgi:hypothetical protein